MIDRRGFIRALAGGLLAAPVAAQAQPAGKVWQVGVLVTANPRIYDSFVDELRRLGYVDGQNVVLEFRNAEGQYERFPALAAELVRAGVDVILAGGGTAVFRAARGATTMIPIVIVAIDYDPLALKFVANLARSGGNATGVFLQQIELTAKRMELLKALLPKLTRRPSCGTPPPWTSSRLRKLRHAPWVCASNRWRSEILRTISAAHSRRLSKAAQTRSMSPPPGSSSASARRSPSSQ